MSQTITPPSVSNRIQVYRRTKAGFKLVDAPLRPTRKVETEEDIQNAMREIEIMEERRLRFKATFIQYLCNPNGIKKQNYSQQQITERLER